MSPQDTKACVFHLLEMPAGDYFMSPQDTQACVFHILEAAAEKAKISVHWQLFQDNALCNNYIKFYVLPQRRHVLRS